MNKQTALRIVVVLMAADFLSLVATVLLRTIIPYEIYSVAHPVIGFLFIAFAGTHAYLNWGWIRQNYFKRK
jgi:hypothetical protein